MKINENITDTFLALCKKNKKNTLQIFGMVDINALIKIHTMISKFKNLNQIDSDAFKQSEKILGKEIYNIYVHLPKINALTGVFMDALNKDENFKKNIYESQLADSTLNKNEQKNNNTENDLKKFEKVIDNLILNTEKMYKVTLTRKDALVLLKSDFGDNVTERLLNKENQHIKANDNTSKIFEQTTKRMVLYMEEKHKITITRKEAISVLTSEFGDKLKHFIQNEKRKRFNHRKKHISEKSQNQKANSQNSILINHRENTRKVGFKKFSQDV